MMNQNLVSFTFGLSLCAVQLLCVYAGTLYNVEALQNTLLSNYSKNLRPLMDTNSAVTVNLSFNLNNIKEFDDVDGRFSVVAYMMLTWIDPRMMWNPLDYNYTYGIQFLETEVWTPTLTLINPYNKFERFGTDFLTVYFLSDGKAIWTPGNVLTSTCASDVTYFPFDKQVCRLVFACWGFTESQIRLQILSPEVQTTFFTEHGTWKLLKSTVELKIDNGSPFVFVYINMKRKPVFYVVNTILPVMFIMMLNIWVFILPVESGERVSYSITVLLALAVFLTLVGENLPNTSEPMCLLSYFLLGALSLSSFSCFMTVFNLYTYHLPEEKQIPLWMSRVTGITFCNRTNKRGVVYPWAKEDDEEKPRITDHPKDQDDTCVSKTKATWREVSNFLDKFMLGFNVLGMFVFALAFFLSTMS